MDFADGITIVVLICSSVLSISCKLVIQYIFVGVKTTSYVDDTLCQCFIWLLTLFLLFFTKIVVSLIWIISKVLFMVYNFGVEVRRWGVRKIYKWTRTLTLEQIEGLRYTHFLHKDCLFSSQESNSFSHTDPVSQCMLFCNKIEINILLNWCQ